MEEYCIFRDEFKGFANKKWRDILLNNIFEASQTINLIIEILKNNQSKNEHEQLLAWNSISYDQQAEILMSVNNQMVNFIWKKINLRS